MDNLRQAFPQKTEQALKTISKKFYHSFIDNWIETIKLISISKSSLNKRATGNFDILHQLYAANSKAVQGNYGHFINWEIANLHSGINQPFPLLTVYFPQSSKIMTRLIVFIRSRWGNYQLPSTEMVRSLIPWRKKRYLLALVGDQSADPENANWLYFMNRPAPFAKGPEKFARGQGIPVVVMTTTKSKRGHYHFEYSLLCDDPQSLPEGELMRRYVQHLEKNIELQPEIYLWSHRRWKHPWKTDYSDRWIDDKQYPV